MSPVNDTPLAGVDGWCERTCLVGGREQRWLERTIDAATGRVEQFFGRHEYVLRSTDVTARRRTAAPAAPVVCPRPERVVDRSAATVDLRSSPCGLTVHIGTRALQTIHEEIQAHRAGIEVLGYETGGGIFGPPIRGWHTRADVTVATVAAGPRRAGQLEIAYGKIEATEATLIRDRSRLRRIGDFHCHPTCPPGRVGEPSDTDMSTWLRELDRIDRSRSATRYLGIIATAGPRGWSSKPRLHAWVVSRDDRGRPICQPATLTESRYARAAWRRSAENPPLRELVTDVGDLAERALRLRGIRVNPCARHHSRHGFVERREPLP